MAFDDLALAHLDRETYGHFFSNCARLVERGRNKMIPLFYGLAISNDFSGSLAFSDSMMHIGGIGVLGHMVDVKGEGVLFGWRGTHDIDIVLIDKSAYSVLAPYIKDSVMSNSLGDKISATLGDSGIDCLVSQVTGDTESTSCKADVYLPRQVHTEIGIGGYKFTREEIAKARKVNIMGADITIPDLYTIFKMKLGVGTERDNLPEEKHMIDIFNLVGVAEAYGHSEADVFAGLETADLRERLIAVINYLTAESGFHTGGIRTILSTAITAPSDKYVGRLRALNKDLKKRRRI